VIGVYFFPLLGGWIADRLLGKYRTILWLSLVYCAGHACLAAFEDNRTGFYTGLFLIALGSGGIKPLVVSFVGDQFDQSNKHIAKVTFDAFYWTINFGSFFASLLMPIFLRNYGGAVAFGIPGILMFIATVIFWAGRKKYVNVPPASADPHSFLRVARSALLARAEGRAGPGSSSPSWARPWRSARWHRSDRSASWRRPASHSSSCWRSAAQAPSCNSIAPARCIPWIASRVYAPCCASSSCSRS
jgi:POT family proton-dependent oligopeptide transporter